MAGDGSDSKPDGGIPAWQRTHNSPPAQSSNTKEVPQQDDSPVHYINEDTKQQITGNSKNQPTLPLSQEELVQQATRFLQDERIRNEPREKKVEFLETKGLQKEYIDRALEIADTTPSPTSTPITATPTPSSLPANPPSTVPQTPLSPRDFVQSSQMEMTPPTTPKRDAPPIITYPEFLVHSQKPPPIITANRLLNTAYAAAGVFAGIYGTSKYLVQPMSETLTHARHEFHEHSLSHVQSLNAKLGEVISVEPSEVPPRHHQDPRAMAFAAATGKHSEDDATSVDSDPTELFHRDFGTQTTEELEKAAKANESSSSSSEDGAFDLDDATDAAVSSQTRKLGRLKTLVSDLLGDTGSETETAGDTSAALKVLTEQLDSMAYPMGTYSNNAIYGGSAFGNAFESTGTKGKKDKESDEMSRVKAEIRALKGMLLSARNFPGAAANTSAVLSGGARTAAFPQAQTAGAGE